MTGSNRLSVEEAFEQLLKALEAEAERLKDPAVQVLLRKSPEFVQRIQEQVRQLYEKWQRPPPERAPREPPPREGVARKRLGVSTNEFKPLLLKALAQLGGRAEVKVVLRVVYEMVKDRLSDEDLKPIPSGAEIRWREKARWAAQRLKSEGLLRRNSLYGIWELSESGWEEAKKLLAQEQEESSLLSP